MEKCCAKNCGKTCNVWNSWQNLWSSDIYLIFIYAPCFCFVSSMDLLRSEKKVYNYYYNLLLILWRDNLDKYRSDSIWQRTAQDRLIWRQHVEAFAQPRDTTAAQWWLILTAMCVISCPDRLTFSIIWRSIIISCLLVSSKSFRRFTFTETRQQTCNLIDTIKQIVPQSTKLIWWIRYNTVGRASRFFCHYGGNKCWNNEIY